MGQAVRFPDFTQTTFFTWSGSPPCLSILAEGAEMLEERPHLHALVITRIKSFLELKAEEVTARLFWVPEVSLISFTDRIRKAAEKGQQMHNSDFIKYKK